MGKRRTFTAEFKQEAVQLAKRPDVALSACLLRRWVQASDQKGEIAFPEKGKSGLPRELNIAR